MPAGPYSISDIQNYFEYVIKNFEMLTGNPQYKYTLTELRTILNSWLKLDTMFSSLSVKKWKKITKDTQNSESFPQLEVTEVVLVHCNLVNNAYQHDSRVLYTFTPNKPFESLTDIYISWHLCSYIWNLYSWKHVFTWQSVVYRWKDSLWFTDENFMLSKLEDRSNLAQVINWYLETKD